MDCITLVIRCLLCKLVCDKATSLFLSKTFWFELKEILRTLVIFAIIEIAVMAFTTWSFLVIYGC